jgi:exoribonuclease-2
LQQNNISKLNATLFKENMVRADDLPLVLPVMGANHLERGTKVIVKLGDINLMTLDISGTVIDIRVAAQVGDMQVDDALEDESEETGALSIAVDLVDTTDTEVNAEASAEVATE